MYDPSNPSISYFTIGEVISVLALLLAFSQFLKPIAHFRLHVGSIKLLWVYGLVFVWSSLIFVAAVLPFIPGESIWILGYPAVWEITGGSLLFITVAVLIYISHKHAIFNKWNSERYMAATATHIATISDDELRQLGNEIYWSVSRILDICERHDLEKMGLESKGGKYTPSEHTLHALQVLHIWSDRDFCRVLVCKCPATIIRVFTELSNRRMYEYGYAFVQQIVDQLIVNEGSILYKEDDYSGLGIIKECTRAVFGNFQLVNSRLMPLFGWRYTNRIHTNIWQVEKYISATNVTLQSYFDVRGFHEHPRCFYHANDVLESIAQRAVLSVNRLDGPAVYDSESYQILTKIAFGLKQLLKTIYDNDATLDITYNFDPNNYDPLHDYSIYGVAASWAFSFLEALAQAERNDWQLRLPAIELWLDIFKPYQSTKASEEIAKRLIVRLKKNIDENLDSTFPRYPAITRLIIQLHGLTDPKLIVGKSLEEEFFAYFYKELKARFAALAIKRPIDASAMLPENTIYDAKKRKLTHKVYGKVHSTLIVDPPAPRAKKDTKAKRQSTT